MIEMISFVARRLPGRLNLISFAGNFEMPLPTRQIAMYKVLWYWCGYVLLDTRLSYRPLLFIYMCVRRVQTKKQKCSPVSCALDVLFDFALNTLARYLIDGNAQTH